MRANPAELPQEVEQVLLSGLAPEEKAWEVIRAFREAREREARAWSDEREELLDWSREMSERDDR